MNISTAGSPLLDEPSAARRRIPGPWQRLLTSVGVWVLYVPHLAIVRLMGPQLGRYWITGFARLHWLATCCGRGNQVLDNLTSVHSHLNDPSSPRQILKRHLDFKHQCFADLRLHADARRRKRKAYLRWSAPVADQQVFRGVLKNGRGVIAISYHFGDFRLAAHAASQIFSEAKFCQVRYPEVVYAQMAYSPAARLAWQQGLLDDRDVGSDVLYLRPDVPPLELVHRLRRKQVLLFAADGMIASDFVQVPFLGGSLKMPCGWAFLAGLTGAPVVVLMDSMKTGREREVHLSKIIRCDSTSPADVWRAVAEATSVLEQHVRDKPWAWHPWQRLRISEQDGKPNYELMSMANMVPPESATVPGVESAGQRIKTRPRVAIVSNAFTPYRIQLHQRLLRQIPEVEFYSLVTHAPSFQRWANLRAPDEIRPVSFHHGEPSDQQTRQRYALREFRKGGKIIRWLKQHQIDAVLCQGYGDFGRMRILRWCHGNGIPSFLYSDANILTDRQPSLKRRFKFATVRQAVRWCQGVMPCGSNGRALFERCGAPRNRTFYFPFLPDIELFTAPPEERVRAMRQRWSLSPDRQRLLFVGRMVPDKRPDLLLRAFMTIAPDYPDWDLLFVGEGPLRAALQAQSKALSARVSWLGQVDNTVDLAAVFQLTNVLVLPSDKEPWGVVVIEAVAAGRAVVASDLVGAATDLIEPGVNGAIVKAGDVQSLVAALGDVMQHASEYGSNCRQVLDSWLRWADPVSGVRNALDFCGVLPANNQQLRSEPLPTTQAVYDQA